MKIRTYISAIVLLLIAVVLACTPQESKKPPDEVTVQLKWTHQAQFAGFYMAEEKGYYAEENIKINYLEGGVGIDLTDAVISGKADFGVVAPEDILIKRSEGNPITAIAAIYRRSAVVYCAMADSGIQRPFDFVGKTVAGTGTGGSNRDLEFQFYALMKKLDLDTSGVKMVPYDSKYAAFLKGEADVTPAYATRGLILLRQKGLKLNLIWPSDYGIHFYSDTLITTDRLIKENPELVTRFLRATLRGWRDAVGNSNEAVTITMKHAKVDSLEMQTAMMEAMLPLVHTGEDQIGWMNAKTWEGMYQILLDQKILKKPFNVESVYTMKFIKNIYGGEAK